MRLAPSLALLVAWCVVIFIVSGRPNLQVTDDDLLDFILRKAAHLAEYALLAWLAWRVTRAGGMSTFAGLPLSWCFTLVYAISDEWHQTFVDGRVGHPRDVAIDMAGATAALVAVWLATRRTDPTQERPA